jgi:thiamine kinase-like enzyme
LIGQGQAQLLFVPYNYLIDPTIRATLAPDLLRNAVIVFDEVRFERHFSNSKLTMCSSDAAFLLIMQ